MNPILPRVQIAKHHTQWHRLAIAILLPSLLALAPFAMQAMAHAPENAPHKPMPDNDKRQLHGVVTDENGYILNLAVQDDGLARNGTLLTEEEIKAIPAMLQSLIPDHEL